MAKPRTTYPCKECGAAPPTWEGRCSRCGAWDALEETVVRPASGTASRAARGARPVPAASAPPKKLKNTSAEESERVHSSFSGWDTVLGDGLVKDSVTILTARPGAGKSTLLLQLAQEYAARGLKVLYASGEESGSQIRARADRLFPSIHDNIWLLASSDLEEVEAQAYATDADVLVIDSIQTFRLPEHPQRAGTPVQTVACTERIMDLCKNPQKKRAALLVGHMTKSDEMAGLRTLEHMVDTVLLLEGDPSEELRMLRSTKNRFGATGEIGLFEMKQHGLMEVKDPSQYFTTDRTETGVIGSAKTILREGTRMLVIEIESLVSKSYTAYPMRISENMPRDRLNTLLSVLEERAGLPLGDKNVIVKTTGNIRLPEPAADLAVLMSVASSVKNRPIPSDTAFVAEVGLTGELKRVSHAKQRIRELRRLGYRTVITAPAKETEPGTVQIKTIGEVIQKISG